ncbi:uncharacterized protein DUF1080 [Marinoscillum furvescens DSM 4134]|uniref:Uncharacterized protein DUF1080 n=2 Tax=Marinoscillum furvescens TaxID=1026 RepID=A0A3D9LH15_MARFU|nr:uncharacterized protein DUF1080 [Marinoscillum furvescens DSM 4134]
MKQSILLIGLFWLFSIGIHAQDGYEYLKLEDMAGFEPQAGNWQVVGDVVVDPRVDPHATHEPQPKKKKKRGKQEEAPEPIRVTSGTGVLINLPTEEQKDNLLTSWQHGDLILELEVMMPPGSNSGIFLQGRYEIQLFDSYGVRLPQFSDIGGIYRNWEQDIQKSYMGKAPLLNAAKAPGLWQSLKIDFKAPRFDEAGNKIANARIQEVVLNGMVIHKNVELPTYTGGQISKQEAPMGPLLIQGDHGAVAFRNIRYKKMKEGQAKLGPLQYEVRRGRFESEKQFFEEGEVVASGETNTLTYEVADEPQHFGVSFTGKLTVPDDALHTFRLHLGCVGVLKINGEVVAEGYNYAEGSVALSAGAHDFQLIYSHFQAWRGKRLGVQVATANSYWQDLHAFSSFPPGGSATAPILVEPGSEPRLVRAFARHPDVDGLLTHAVGVGTPEGVHFLYDQTAGSPVSMWRGGFVDATPMWHDRGNATFNPQGLVQYLSAAPSIAIKGQAKSEVITKGYQLDPATGLPTFNLEVGGVAVQDQLKPEDGSALAREIIFPEGVLAEVQAATASQIEALGAGLYAVGDKQYFISVPAGMQSEVRSLGPDQQALVITAPAQKISYLLIW